MHGGHGFTFIEHFPLLGQLPVHVASSLLISTLVIFFALIAGLLARRALLSEGQGLLPDSRWSYLNFFEIVAERLFELSRTVLGEHSAPKYFPLVGSLFLFIFVSNVSGLFPGFLPPTDNLNTTLSLGVFVFFYYNYQGIKENGLGYLKHFMGPVWWLAWFILPLEIVSHVFRPISLGLRLRGNIYADHMILNIFNGFDYAGWFVPIIFYGLGLFVCFVQSLVFTLLTMVFVSLATVHDH